MKPADRKKQLIAQGRIFRAEVMLAKEDLRAGLRPDSLAKSALSQATLAAIALWRNRSAAIPAAGLNAATLLPLVVSGASALARNKSRLMPLLRGALIAGTIAGVVALVLKSRRQPETVEQLSDEEQAGGT